MFVAPWKEGVPVLGQHQSALQQCGPEESLFGETGGAEMAAAAAAATVS